MSYYLRLASGYATTYLHKIDDISEAPALYRDWIDKYDLGASQLGRDSGSVRDEEGYLRARVSYNGRLWTPEGQPLVTTTKDATR